MRHLTAPALLLLVLAATGCERDAAPRATPRPSAPEPSAASEPPPVEEEAPAEEADPPVDSLSDAELEAACYQGRQEACDRLGH